VDLCQAFPFEPVQAFLDPAEPDLTVFLYAPQSLEKIRELIKPDLTPGKGRASRMAPGSSASSEDSDRFFLKIIHFPHSLTSYIRPPRTSRGSQRASSGK
jgi:hypothetical protein